MSFELESSYRPRGDQAQAIAKLTKSVEAGNRHQTLLGVTGSGKTFTIGECHPRTRPADAGHLAQQDARGAALLGVQAVLPATTRSNISSATSTTTSRRPTSRAPTPTSRRIRRSTRRSSACGSPTTSSLLSRRDVIVVASVSCIYGLGSPEDYMNMLLTVKRGQQITREAVLGRLVDMLYERNDIALRRAGNSACAATWSRCIPRPRTRRRSASNSSATRSIAITRFDPLTGHAHEQLDDDHASIPAKQFVTPADKMNRALVTIREELDERIISVRKAGQTARGAAPEDAHRIRSRDDAGDGLLLRHRELLAALSAAARRARGRSRCSTFSRRIFCS